MYIGINEEILKLKEKLRENQKLKSSKKATETELSEKRSQQIKLEKELKKERKDFEKLEKLSLSSMFYSLIGRKEERLDKEKEEYFRAKLKYDENITQIEELERQLKIIIGRLRGYKGVNQKYEELLKEKEKMLIREGGELGSKLKNEFFKIDEFKIDIKEIKEAIEAGENVLGSLNEVKKKLESAKGWGTWDMLGGGIFVDMAKHSAINEANDIAKIVQYDLKSFKKELSDVNEFTDIHVNISSFASFADFFLDGIFADWFVQSKINDSLTNAREAINKVESIVGSLSQDLRELEYKVSVSETIIKDILEV